MGTSAPHLPVLVVDDDLALRTILCALLTTEGYCVQRAAHGGIALDLLRASPHPMVVTLDLKMPIGDGETVLKAVAADKHLTQRYAFILVTGDVQHATSGRVMKLRETLGIPLVRKPFMVEELLEAVAAAEQCLLNRCGQSE